MAGIENAGQLPAEHIHRVDWEGLLRCRQQRSEIELILSDPHDRIVGGAVASPLINLGYAIRDCFEARRTST